MDGPDRGAGLDGLQRLLGHRFRDASLLDLALTHSARQGGNQQRLEFLGDAILGATVAATLYARHPGWSEGDMSVARTRLVRQESLADCARRIGLPGLLRISPGVLRTGPVHQRDSVLADTLEAVLGAVFLDGGFEAALAVGERLLGAGDDATAAGELPAKDPKTRLQEWLQGRGWPVPDYQLLERQGPANAPRFHVSCRAGRPSRETQAQGRSRRAAEQAAAELMLAQLDPATPSS